MSKVHNTEMVLIDAVTCIDSSAWSGSLIYPGSVLASHHPSSSPFHPLVLLPPLLLHARDLRKGLRAACILRWRHQWSAVYSPGTILSCRVEKLVKLSTSRRIKPDASSSKTQSFDVDQAKRAYDPKPAASGETSRHERAARKGLPCRGATSGTYMFHLAVLAE